jgi:hypothetical protein
LNIKIEVKDLLTLIIYYETINVALNGVGAVIKSASARCAALLAASIVSACATDPPVSELELERPNVAPVTL